MWLLFPVDPPEDPTPYQISTSPAVVEDLVGPLVQVSPPPVTEETVTTGLEALVATCSNTASPAVTFAGVVTVTAETPPDDQFVTPVWTEAMVAAAPVLPNPSVTEVIRELASTV